MCMWLCMCVFVVRIGSWVCVCIGWRLHARVLTEVWGVQYGLVVEVVRGCLIGALLLETDAWQERLLLYKVTCTHTHTLTHSNTHKQTHTLTKRLGSNVIMSELAASQLVKEDTG